MVGTLGPGKGGGQARFGPAAARVCGQWKGATPGGLSGERLAPDGVRGGRPGAVLYRVGKAGVGERLARAFHEHRDVAHFQVLIRRM